MSPERSRSGGILMGYHVEPVVEVFPEPAVLNVFFSGRGWWWPPPAHPPAPGLLPPTRSSSPSCKALSSLAWSATAISEISSSKMVPPLASFEFAQLAGHRAGEGTLFMAEKLAFQKGLPAGLAQFTATKGAFFPRGVLVQKAGEKLLAGAAFAGNQHRGPAVGHGPGHFQKLFSCGDRR